MPPLTFKLVCRNGKSSLERRKAECGRSDGATKPAVWLTFVLYGGGDFLVVLHELIVQLGMSLVHHVSYNCSMKGDHEDKH